VTRKTRGHVDLAMAVLQAVETGHDQITRILRHANILNGRGYELALDLLARGCLSREGYTYHLTTRGRDALYWYRRLVALIA
jgi:predicted transcriptional regulator